MNKIIKSLSVIAFVGAIALAGTGAWFHDTETSEGNVFTAGAIDLKIDSVCHYDGMICVYDTGLDKYVWEEECSGSSTYRELLGEECFCSWEEDDLDLGAESKKFFNYNDLKPGDEGENTISIHIVGNDAWGVFKTANIIDEDNDITEPEDKVDNVMDGKDGTDDGDLDTTLEVSIWLDQGIHPGFQCPTNEPACNADWAEGDNKQLEDPYYTEPILWAGLAEDLANEYIPFSPIIAEACAQSACEYGLTVDGHLVGCVTYYFGVAWNLPGVTTGNIAQTDSWGADMIFEVTQYRHNAVDPYLNLIP